MNATAGLKAIILSYLNPLTQILLAPYCVMDVLNKLKLITALSFIINER